MEKTIDMISGPSTQVRLLQTVVVAVVLGSFVLGLRMDTAHASMESALVLAMKDSATATANITMAVRPTWRLWRIAANVV